jgi:hypothetical protein
LSEPQHNFFSLVRDPAQTAFDRQCTTPPVPPFETGFLGYDRVQIRDFIAEHLSEAPQCSSLEPDQYALLDERSSSESTVVIGMAFSSLHDRDPGTMTEEELEQWEHECDENDDAPKDLWREFRVKFDEVEKLTTTLTMESDFTQKLYNDEFVASHTDEQGVFQLARAQHAFEAFHGVEEGSDEG